jgi:hypothetical protein
VLTSEGTHYIVETKGMEDINVANKDRAAQLWCENATQLAKRPWAYVKVRQTEYKKFQPTQFEDLLILKSEGSLGLCQIMAVFHWTLVPTRSNSLDQLRLAEAN